MSRPTRTTTPYHRRPVSPVRLAAARVRALAALKTQGRPMTRGELIAFAIPGFGAGVAYTVLDGLVTDGLVTVEKVFGLVKGGWTPSYLYRLTPEGAARV